MSPAQSDLATQLLREALEWIGMDRLTPDEEERAQEVQARIERLLGDLGAIPRYWRQLGMPCDAG